MLGTISDYEVLSVIGSGSFGTCYKVQRKNDGDVFVWKAIDYGNLEEEKKEALVCEVNLLRSLKCPNIVRYYGHIVHKESTTLYVVMEYCSKGDLAALISTCKRNGTSIQEKFVWRLLYQVAGALRMLQSQRVLHRDVKPANIFLDDQNDAKLGDFGLAKAFPPKTKTTEALADSFVGTPGYMSPEVVKGEKYNGKSDVWALGCVVYELCSLKTPFSGQNMKQLARHISTGRYAPIPQQYSTDLHRVVDFMLTVSHLTRPDVRAILHHPTVVTQMSRSQGVPPIAPAVTKLPAEGSNHGDLSERETLLRMRELALEEKEKIIQDRENRLKQHLPPKPNLDIDSTVAPDSPMFRPTAAKLNPALIPRPLNFPVPPRRVRFDDKNRHSDDITYKWYDIEPNIQYRREEVVQGKRPMSDSGPIQVKAPAKPLSDGGTNKHVLHVRGKYTYHDLEKAVAERFVSGTISKSRKVGKENIPGPVKHTQL